MEANYEYIKFLDIALITNDRFVRVVYQDIEYSRVKGIHSGVKTLIIPKEDIINWARVQIIDEDLIKEYVHYVNNTHHVSHAKLLAIQQRNINEELNEAVDLVEAAKPYVPKEDGLFSKIYQFLFDNKRIREPKYATDY